MADAARGGRGVAALAAIGIALALALALGPSGERAPASARLLPGLGGPGRALQRLRVERSGAPALVVVWAATAGSARAGRASLIAPIEAPLEPAEALALADTLEYLSARRAVPRAPEHGLGAPRARLVVGVAGDEVALRVGAELIGQDRVLAGVEGGDRSLLVDGDQVRALLRGADELRDRHPLRELALGRLSIAEADGARLELRDGAVAVAGHWLPVDRAALDALAAALAAVEIVRFADRAVAGTDGGRAAPGLVVADGARVALRATGPCAEAGTTGVVTAIGAGCATDAALEALRLRAREPWRLARRAPFALAPVRVRRLSLAVGGQRAEVAVDAGNAEAVRGFLDTLAAAVGAPVALDGATPAGAIAVEGDAAAGAADDDAGAADGAPREVVALLRRPDGGLALRRAGEALGFALEPGVEALLTPLALRPLDLVAREPSDVVAIELLRGGRAVGALRRGAILEEWSATGAVAAVTPAAAGAATAALARLRAAAWVAAAARPAHGFRGNAVAIELRAAGGSPERHVVALGGPVPGGGCHARLDRDPAVFRLDAHRCAALTGLFAR